MENVLRWDCNNERSCWENHHPGQKYPGDIRSGPSKGGGSGFAWRLAIFLVISTLVYLWMIGYF